MSSPVGPPTPHTRGGGPTHARREGALLAAGGFAAAAGLLLVHAVDPNEPGHYPTCPFLALTGRWCPGCGSMRAFAALSHLDLATALARNPLAVLAAGWLACWYVVSWWRLLTHRPRTTMARPGVLYALLGLVCGYWVARNIPGWTWLSPA